MSITHKASLPSGWGADGVSAPADDANTNTVSPSDYLGNHDGRWVRRLTADATRAVTSFADINATDLTFSVAANKKYRFRMVLIHQTNATTTGARFGVNGPASPTLVMATGRVTITPATAGTAVIAETTVTAYDTATTTHGTGPGAVNALAIVEGVLINAANAGTLRPRFASEVAVAGGLVVKAGSYMEVEEFDN